MITKHAGDHPVAATDRQLLQTRATARLDGDRLPLDIGLTGVEVLPLSLEGSSPLDVRLTATMRGPATADAKLPAYSRSVVRRALRPVEADVELHRKRKRLMEHAAADDEPPPLPALTAGRLQGLHRGYICGPGLQVEKEKDRHYSRRGYEAADRPPRPAAPLPPSASPPARAASALPATRSGSPTLPARSPPALPVVCHRRLPRSPICPVVALTAVCARRPVRFVTHDRLRSDHGHGLADPGRVPGPVRSIAFVRRAGSGTRVAIRHASTRCLPPPVGSTRVSPIRLLIAVGAHRMFTDHRLRSLITLSQAARGDQTRGSSLLTVIVVHIVVNSSIAIGSSRSPIPVHSQSTMTTRSVPSSSACVHCSCIVHRSCSVDGSPHHQSGSW